MSVYAKRTEPPHVGLCFGSPTPIPLGLRFTGADRRTSEKGDALVTVEHRSHLIEECHRRAAEARRLADTPGVSLDERDDLLVVERRWLSLAACFGGRIESAPRTEPYGPNSGIRLPPRVSDHELSF